MAQKVKKARVKSATKMPMRNNQNKNFDYFGYADKSTRAKITGFTLIEVLIVIAIISIIASVATLTIHFNKNKQLETFARNLANLITLAEEEAMLRPAVIGLAVTPQTIQFYSYQEKTHSWQPLTHKVFRAPYIPENTIVSLSIHGKIIPPNEKTKLIITPGDTPEFVIFIGKSEEKPLYQVIGDANGNVYAK
jgi:type II secretion system protein H